MVGMGYSDTREDETSEKIDHSWEDLYEKVEESFNGGGGAREESKKLVEDTYAANVSMIKTKKRMENEPVLAKARMAKTFAKKAGKKEKKEKESEYKREDFLCKDQAVSWRAVSEPKEMRRMATRDSLDRKAGRESDRKELEEKLEKLKLIR